MAPPTPGPLVEGQLVDVSARGLRIQCEQRRPLPGTAVTFEIHLRHPGQPSGPPRLVLDGKGRVIWVEDVEEGTPAQAGVCFDAPVDLRPSFPHVKVF